MAKLTLHARIEIGLALALLLGSCGQSAPRGFTEGDYDKLDVADVNSRNAIARVDALESRISVLEEHHASDARTMKLLLDTSQSGLDREGDMADRLAAVEDRLGM